MHRRGRQVSRRPGGLLAATLFSAALGLTPSAVTRLPSADGEFWDVQDTSPWAQDSGGIATGGRASPFNGFGYLKLQVRRPDGSLLVTNQYLRGFGLAHDGAERFDSITPVVAGGMVVARAIHAPRDADYLRYVDSFTNATDEPRTVDVAWGGAAGAYAEGGLVAVATTSNGDRHIDLSDGFVTVMQNATGVDDPIKGPSGHGPSAHVLGSATTAVLKRVGDMYADPFTDEYPGFDPAHIAYVFTLKIPPGQTVALMTFVAKGLSEVYDVRGGPPATLRDALVATAFEPVYAGSDARVPAPGSEITRVTETARRLLASPDLRGLTSRQRAQIVNWTLPAERAAGTPETARGSFNIFEKTVSELQDALAIGTTTSEDLVRDYLTRIAAFDRHGPAFHALLSLNPRAIASARERDAERAAGQVRSVFHGIPIVFKDNIDAIGLPATGGSLALAEHRPRLDARVVAGMRDGGAIVLGKTNLDEFPFGDFGISTVGGTIGNAYDPSLSTAGSSGGSAVAVTASLAALGFGTDTCNSLSNPASFASLATIRTTRGLTSRAGVMPLNPYNDAVGPMAKSVRDVALALDLVAGSDHEDAVTAGASSHLKGSFASALDAGALKGARIGLLRQRFVGFTGEREIATMMERVADEMRQTGATIVEVAIPNLDEHYRAARGSAPRSLKAGWTAYLARGAKPGDKVLTIEELIASGKLAPKGAERLRAALAPTPEGPALAQATAAFEASREAFRQVFVDVMHRERLDALLYPANQARPHTHEGGLERYGTEPGTCEESAMTGLPQVTVPAGFIGGRHPFGISLLGRMWDDGRLLALGYAYEQATRHRRPPPGLALP
jgi:amidase